MYGPLYNIGSASVPVDARRCTSAQYAARLNNLAAEQIFRSSYFVLNDVSYVYILQIVSLN